jgi:hypothetical protein
MTETNHEAEIGTPALGTPALTGPPASSGQTPRVGAPSTIGNIFYGLKGYLAMGAANGRGCT